ncbi:MULTISPECIES: DEAD/DEAH box helicase [unclassified Nocardioides]|uniref:DEAD/DEAH box helicase n=1 Tax=unclassified Nocardioides TaxID=2615069 RepID=UPI003015594F
MSTTAANWKPSFGPISGPFRGSLKHHQSEGLAWLLERPNAVLADDVGLGKTVQALAYIGELDAAGQLPRHGNSICRVLWITDAPLQSKDRAEVEKFLPDFTVATSLDPELRDSQKQRGIFKAKYGLGPDVLTVSYEWATSRRHWLAQVGRPALVVLDEAMKIKGGGIRFEAIELLTGRADRVLAMTATPYENNPMELYWLLRAARVPGLWGEGVFKNQFVEWEKREVTFGQWENRPVGWVESRLPEVRDLLSRVMLHRDVTAAGLTLPDVVRIERTIPLSPAQKQEYDAASQRQGRATLQAMDALSKAFRSDSPLIDALLVELHKRHRQQVVIYCELLFVLDLVEQELQTRGISYARIEGKVKEDERAAAVERFRSGEAQILLGSRVLERGLNLQHCRTLISLDVSWNPARERQREGRLRRIGSSFDAVEHVMLLPDTPLVAAKWAKLAIKRDQGQLAVGV